MDLYDAIADPVRRQIVELLVRRPLPARRVAKAFGHISRPAVSRHLRLLREVGLVDADLVGRERIYRADIEPLAEVETWIAGLRPRWEQHLDAMETEVHRTRRERERRETSEAQVTGPAPTTEEQSA
ncbi:MAG TPA: metalloregulator ArsR/SmtB family transcription factor [Acidimicrobiales bacterium]